MAHTLADLQLEAAREFSKIVQRDLADHLPEIIDTNRYIDSFACATHDFCDANELMAEAMQTALGLSRWPDLENDEMLEIWNGAWELAKAANFDPARIPAGN